MRSPVEAFDSGSNYSFGDKLERVNFPRSAFDLGHLVTTTIENCGQVQVLDVIETLPGDDHEINIKSLIRCLPQVVPLYSRQRIYIYAFWNRYSDLWANFNTFMTKGYNGDEILTTPVYNRNKNLVVTGSGKVLPNSLADGFGIQQGISEGLLEGLNAFDSMQLLRIWRDYFLNKNFYVNDRVILPHDDSRFRLNDDGELLSAKDEEVTFKFDLCSDSFSGYQVDSVTGARTFSQFVHDWQQDYFTSGLPWPQRGTAATLNVTFSTDDNINASIFTKINGQEYQAYQIHPKGDGNSVYHVPFIQKSGNMNHPLPFIEHDGSTAWSHGVYNYDSLDSSLDIDGQAFTPSSTDRWTLTDFQRYYAKVPLNDLNGEATITLNKLRELAVEQHELEVMARTDGSYAEFGIAFFHEKSKNAIDYKSVYIGGTYDNIQYSEVLQTSQQYEKTESGVSPIGSPLGTYGGHGIGSANGYIGRLHCDDYGQIMILCCIMPDVYYSTGLERRLTNRYQSDFFLPERAKLGLRPTLKKEIFYSGIDDVDNDLFNYQNPFDEYRYLPNRIKGKIADPDSKNFYPYTQSRKIENSPEFNEGFVEATNIRKDYLQAPLEVAFTAQFKIEDRCVRALPYKAIPANIIN